ncbi:G2/mitotic-specific cyclin-B2 [Leguminivora glycinivorella]|uniref:G2/mitotic-specific cyclin-B2 n=1 Tax=Leguminivora glycinivorella TaxID=1035111 RepID=UPI00200DC1C8|nr:G2/mitotic-specific cyclin-B2 [Leguminivora glycinivorella]
MEIQVRRQQRLVNLHDQENANVLKGKSNAILPVKRPGLTARGALGDLNTNAQAQRDIAIGKVAVATAEYEKKATLNRATVKSNYSHVRSKIDTGLAATKPIIQPSSRPPLRREESTAGHAAKAAARTKAVLKETQPKTNDENILKPRKPVQDKKPSRLSAVNEDSKPVLKEPTESLGKLKLAEPVKQELHLEKEHPPLPADVEDIDAGDNNSPLLMSCYIKDIYHYLTELELKYPIEPDHLRKQSVITGKMRATLIDWLVEVQRQFSLVLETFHLTVGIIDRYLQAVPNVQRDQLQLVGVTAMFLASKYEEIYAPEVGDFVYVTDNAYSKADVFQCERDIMSKLGFCLARPIPLSFLRRFVKAAHGTSKNHHLAKYFVDLSLIEYSMAHYRPSELAAAALCLSLHLLSRKTLEEVWTPTMTYYSEYTLEHLDPIIRKIAKIVVNVKNSKHKSVYNRYMDPKVAKVSALPELKEEAIQELAKIPSTTYL